MNITIPGGHLAQANDLSKAGLAALFAQMMNEDTKNYTAEQMAIELEKLGSNVSVSSGLDGITFTVQSLKKNLDKTLALMQERMFNPKFTDEAFDRIKKQALEGFKLQKSQPAAVASTVFARLNYGPKHILGISQSGTEETVKNISLDDIKKYYSNYMTSQGASVVIAGDVKQEDILPKLSFMSKLPNKKIQLAKIDPLPYVDKTKVYLVDVPKAAQTEFRVGYATGLKYDATGDFYKATLTNYPLGTGFTSRLNQYLRETKGWTYGAGSRFSGNKYSGDFAFQSGIRANVTDSALADVMRMIKEYDLTGPTTEEMDFMKKAIAQSEALSYETLGQKASFISRILDYNLQPGFTAKRQQILKNITAADIKAIASKYLNPEKLNILLVADKQRVLEGVKKLGYDIIEVDADGNLVSKKAL
jgi:zinc protease